MSPKYQSSQHPHGHRRTEESSILLGCRKRAVHPIAMAASAFPLATGSAEKGRAKVERNLCGERRRRCRTGRRLDGRRRLSGLGGMAFWARKRCAKREIDPGYGTEAEQSSPVWNINTIRVAKRDGPGRIGQCLEHRKARGKSLSTRFSAPPHWICAIHCYAWHGCECPIRTIDLSHHGVSECKTAR